MRRGNVESSEIFHNGGPPRLASSWRGLRLTAPGGPNLPISIASKIFGSIPAYSRAKTGVRAPMMVSADSANAPTEERQQMRTCPTSSLTEADCYNRSILTPCWKIQRIFRIWRRHWNVANLAILIKACSPHDLRGILHSPCVCCACQAELARARHVQLLLAR